MAPLPDHERVLYATAFYSGLRRGELRLDHPLSRPTVKLRWQRFQVVSPRVFHDASSPPTGAHGGAQRS
jgi:hypothetical protein